MKSLSKKLNLSTAYHMAFLILSVCLSIFLSACEIKTERSDTNLMAEANKPAMQPLPQSNVRKDDRYSLAEDRAKFAELRKDIPEDVRIKNDEKSLYLEWMADYRLDPILVRDKFNNMIRKKRDLFNSDMNKIREEYSKNEKKQRDAFFKELDEQRSEIRDTKMSRDKKSEAYSEIESKRKEFISKTKDERDSFELDYRQKRKDFEEYIKEKTDIFNSEMKIYTEKYRQLNNK